MANSQYEYDHRFDYGLFLDKKFVERKLEVMKSTYEEYKEPVSYTHLMDGTEQKKL